MEEQIITVHIPKDQYRKFAQIAWQVNVPMQTILSQFVADFTSDRWGTAEGTMAKDWFGNHWWSNFEREDFLGWLAQSNQLKERIREQKVIKAEQESVILDFWSRYQDYRKAEDENETEEEESLKEELKKLRQWRKQVHWD